MKIKAMSIFLSAVLIVAVFAGCGGKKDPEPSPSPTPTESASPSPSSSPEADGTEATTGDQAPAGENTPAPTKQPATSNPTKQPASSNPTQAPQQTPAQKPATPPPAPSVSVSDLMSKMVGALPANNMSAMPKDLYAGTYQVDPADYEDVLVYGSAMSVKANEVIVIKAKDSAGVSKAKKALSSRKAALEEQWKNYLPDQYEIVQAGTITSKGLYVTLVIAEGGSNAVAAFNSAI